MSLSKLFRSFGHAFAGFGHAMRAEPNLRWHLVATVFAVGFGVWLKISTLEWIAIVICIGLVIAAELFNTALERLADRVTKGQDELIRQSKDVSSAAVTVLALMSVVIGAIVFAPKLWNQIFDS